MNTSSEFDVSQIISTLQRRRVLIIAVFIVVSVLAIYLSIILPNIYQSNALILVTPQRVPSTFVTSTVTIDLNERMQAIVQEILSRTQLAKIIHEFNLYPLETGQEDLLEHRVERLRKAVKIELRRNNVFQLSYESESPEKAQQVVSRLASFFIEQNLHAREQQALGTKSFINAEAERLRKDLEEQEKVVNRYKAANRYELPDQLDANLRSLEQLRRELDSGGQRIAALQQRKGILEKQLLESDISMPENLSGSLPLSGDAATPYVQAQIKKKELESLLQRYSPKHPDVTRVKREIAALEGSNESASTLASVPEKKPAISPVKQILRTQLTDVDSEIQALRLHHDTIRNQISAFQRRVDNTSIHGIALSKISRDYEITLKKYQDLLAKSLESELSENMEKNQKGEQFQVADPANFPLKPVRPNRRMIVLIGILAGAAAGVGLAFVWDRLDKSFKGREDLTGYINVPLLATIPMSLTRGSVVDQRRFQGIFLFASIGVLAIGVICIRIFAPMYL